MLMSDDMAYAPSFYFFSEKCLLSARGDIHPADSFM